jgi:hypothetical protein
METLMMSNFTLPAEFLVEVCIRGDAQEMMVMMAGTTSSQERAVSLAESQAG